MEVARGGDLIEAKGATVARRRVFNRTDKGSKCGRIVKRKLPYGSSYMRVIQALHQILDGGWFIAAPIIAAPA